MKNYRATVVGIAIFIMLSITGCDDAMQMAGPVMMEQSEGEVVDTPPVTMGEVKQSEPEETSGPTKEPGETIVETPESEGTKRPEPTPEEPEPESTEPPIEPLGPLTVEFTFRDVGVIISGTERAARRNAGETLYTEVVFSQPLVVCHI